MNESTTDIPIILMAGGRGERFGIFTKVLPKPLMPLNDETLIEKIMNIFFVQGFRQFTLVLNYKKELIKNYLKEKKLPYQLSFTEEEKYLGTAGGLSLLRGTINRTFIVCNCDNLLKINFKNLIKWHKIQNAHITVVGYPHKVSLSYGILESNGIVFEKIIEKPEFEVVLNAGLYVMEPFVLEMIQKNEFINMNDLLMKASQEMKISVYTDCSDWIDLGKWNNYRRHIKHLDEKNYFSPDTSLDLPL